MFEKLVMTCVAVPMYAYCISGWAIVLAMYAPYFVVEECIDTWRYVRA